MARADTGHLRAPLGNVAASPSPDHVAVVCLSCCRPDMLFEAMRSLAENLSDSWRIVQVVVIDDMSSDGDRFQIAQELRDCTLVFKRPGDVGQARSLNMGLRLVGTPFALIWEDDCRLTAKGPWLTYAMSIMGERHDIGAVTLDSRVPGDGLYKTSDGVKYRVMPPAPEDSVRDVDTFIWGLDPWPSYTLRPQVIRMAAVTEKVGWFDENETTGNFEYEFGLRYQAAGLRCAVLGDSALEDLSNGRREL